MFPLPAPRVTLADFIRELYALVTPDGTAGSAERFPEEVLGEWACTIETAHRDNGKDFQGNPRRHAFAELCMRNDIGRKFARPALSRNNGKENESCEPR